MVEVARKADALGFDYVAAPDHIVIPEASRDFMGARWYDAVATLAFVASVTRRVRLLTSVIVLPHRHPLLIAKALATLDVLSRGRVIFGVGVGHHRAEFEALRAPYEDRGPATNEGIEVLRRLWTEDSVTHRGRFYRFEDMAVDPRPIQRPIPVWVGGNSKPAARRAFTAAEGWVPFLFSLEELREQVEYGRQQAARVGRTAPFSLVAPLPPIAQRPQAMPHRSLEEVRRKARELAGESEYYRKIAERNLDPGSLSSADEVLERIEQVKALGATHCSASFRFREPAELLDAMDWFGERVMPRAG